MRNLLRTVAVALCVLPIAAHADENPVLIELYTSQGCSSCPPADDLLAKMSADPSILALAFHVDYWDYLGWQDHLAHPSHTERQKAYAHAAGERMIYTPQAIVNGRARLVGSDASALMSAVMQESERARTATVSAQRDGDKVQVMAASPQALPGPYDVLLVRFLPLVTVEILHGENAGETVNYVNTVTSLTLIGQWSGAEALELDAPITGSDQAAVFVQAPQMGEVIAAAVVK